MGEEQNVEDSGAGNEQKANLAASSSSAPSQSGFEVRETSRELATNSTARKFGVLGYSSD